MILVQNGIDLEYILEQMPMPVFKETILIVTRQNVIKLQQLGLTIVTSLGAILSKEGGKQAQDIIQQQVSTIDNLLYSDADDSQDEEDNEGLYHIQRPLRTGEKRRKASKPSPKQIQKMLGPFHQKFAKMTGQRMPSLDSAINAAVKEQSKRRLAEN